MKLSNIANIQSGLHFFEKIANEKSGTIKLIQLKDIVENNKIDYSGLWTNNIQNIKSSHFLKKGDIIFKCRGSYFTATSIETEINNTVATSQFFIIRLNDKNIMPEYLSWFLNEENTQKIIKLGAKGTNIQILSIKYLSNLEIIIPNLNTQKNIIALIKLREKEKEIMKRKNELETLLINHQLRQLVKEDNPTNGK